MSIGYCGGMRAVRAFVPEVLGDVGTGGVAIPAARLHERLPATLAIVTHRMQHRCNDDAAIQRELQGFREFVEFCGHKESETGTPCLFWASY